MERKTASGIMLTLLLISLLTMATNFQPGKAEPGTIYIRADGSIDPPTANITTSDYITYTFTGNNSDSIVVERNDIVVDGAGYTVQGSGSGNGFSWSGINNVTVKNTNIKDFGNGVRIGSSSNSSISRNNITNNAYGIALQSSSNYANISGNNVTANSGYGFAFTGSSNHNSVSGNNVTANGGYGFEVQSSSSYNSISENIIANNGDGGIILYYTNSSIISHNTFINGALVVWGSYHNSVEDNTMNGRPILYYEDVADYSVGDPGDVVAEIVLVKCERMRVEHLNVWMVELEGTSNSNISWNNNVGVWLLASANHNIVSGNNMTAGGAGVRLDSSSNNSICGNNIANNIYGILLNSASNNTIYHNNFIDNTYQAYIYGTSTNVWDDGYPSGGNYWSDYAGLDEKSGPNQDQPGSDGIRDSPHIIGANNKDNYPLTNRWSLLIGDIDGDGDVDQDDLHILSGAYGTMLGGPYYYARADLDQDGDVDVFSLYMLGKNYGKP